MPDKLNIEASEETRMALENAHQAHSAWQDATSSASAGIALDIYIALVGLFESQQNDYANFGHWLRGVQNSCLLPGRRLLNHNDSFNAALNPKYYYDPQVPIYLGGDFQQRVVQSLNLLLKQHGVSMKYPGFTVNVT